MRLLTRGQMTLGTLAVDCFFIISGYLISQSWVNQPSVRAFLAKRVRRIFPGFIAATLLGAFVVTPLFSAKGVAAIEPDFIARYLGNTVRLLEVTPGPAFETNPAAGVVNGSLWSISYEFWCYVGVMGCGLAGLLAKPRWLLAGLVAAVLVSFTFSALRLTPGGWWLGRIFGYPPFWARLLPYFLVGMAYFAFRDRIRPSHVGALVALLAFAVAARVEHGLIFVLPFAAAYLIFWLAYLPVPKLHAFGKHGDYSYGIYLYAFPIQQIIVHTLGTPLSPWIVFVLAWPASIVASIASWWLIERRWVVRATPARMPVERQVA